MVLVKRRSKKSVVSVTSVFNLIILILLILSVKDSLELIQYQFLIPRRMFICREYTNSAPRRGYSNLI